MQVPDKIVIQTRIKQVGGDQHQHGDTGFSSANEPANEAILQESDRNPPEPGSQVFGGERVKCRVISE